MTDDVGTKPFTSDTSDTCGGSAMFVDIYSETLPSSSWLSNDSSHVKISNFMTCVTLLPKAQPLKRKNEPAA